MMTAPESVQEDGNLPAALLDLSDAVSDLVDDVSKLAGRHDCPDCHNETCDLECVAHTCPGHLTPTESLYVQLYDAVYEGRTGQAQGTHRPRSLPTGWLDAQQLLDEIDFAVSLWQPAHALADLPTVARLAAITRGKYRPQDVHGLAQKTTAIKAWAKDISDLFDPPSVKHISAPCPACGATTAHRTDSAGERVRVPSLQIIAGQGCTCQVCRYTWTPDRYLFLCKVLGFELPAGVLE
jgi:hypothetical protein